MSRLFNVVILSSAFLILGACGLKGTTGTTGASGNTGTSGIASAEGASVSNIYQYQDDNGICAIASSLGGELFGEGDAACIVSATLTKYVNGDMLVSVRSSVAAMIFTHTYYLKASTLDQLEITHAGGSPDRFKFIINTATPSFAANFDTDNNWENTENKVFTLVTLL